MSAPQERPQSTGNTKSPGPGGMIDAFLKSPFAGIAPWALMSIVSGPGRFEESVAAALGFALLVMWVGHRRGIKVHLLDIFGAVFFAVLGIIGLIAADDEIRWLELWAGEITNVALAAFAWVTLIIRKPFTMAYAKDTTPAEYWDTPLFKRINDVITAVWAAAFTFNAVVGFIGDAVYRDAGNFWTGWILQLAAIIFAASFTEFYPDYASAKFALKNGEQAQVPSVMKIVDWLPTFVTVTGVVGLITESIDFYLGIGLIVAGSVGSGIVSKFSPAAEEQKGSS